MVSPVSVGIATELDAWPPFWDSWRLALYCPHNRTFLMMMTRVCIDLDQLDDKCWLLIGIRTTPTERWKYLPGCHPMHPQLNGSDEYLFKGNISCCCDDRRAFIRHSDLYEIICQSARARCLPCQAIQLALMPGGLFRKRTVAPLTVRAAGAGSGCLTCRFHSFTAYPWRFISSLYGAFTGLDDQIEIPRRRQP